MMNWQRDVINRQFGIAKGVGLGSLILMVLASCAAPQRPVHEAPSPMALAAPMEAAAPPPPPAPAPVGAAASPLMEVDAVVPKYLRQGEREPNAPLYMYLLFDQSSDAGVQFAALRAVVCLAPQQIGTSVLESAEVPLFIPVSITLRMSNPGQPTLADVRNLQLSAYDFTRATGLLHHLGVRNHDVFLVASQKPISNLRAGQAVSANQAVRIIDLDVNTDYVGAVLNSAIQEAIDGTIFSGPSAKDRGYVVVSFLTDLGGVLTAAIAPITAAQARTSSLAITDQGACR